MKWVVRIVGAVAGLVVMATLGLWLAGFRPGHGHNEASVEIARPVEKVWPWVTEDAKLKQWIHGLEEIRSLTPGVEEIGARMRLVVVLESERTEMEMSMTEFEKYRRLGFDLESVGDPANGFRAKAEYLLEERNGETRVTLKEDSTYYGFLPRLFEPLITHSAQKLEEENLARLKKLAEEEAESTGSTEPAPEMERLKFYVGDWDYAEEYPKSSQFPKGGHNSGRWTAQLGPGGRSVVHAFVSHGTGDNYEGMEVMTWDAKAKIYRDHSLWYDSADQWSYTGQFVGDALVYRGEFDYLGKHVKFRSETRPRAGGGFELKEFMAGGGGCEEMILTGVAKKR